MATGGIAAEIKRRRQEAKERRAQKAEQGISKAKAGRDTDMNFEAGGNISDYDFGKKYNQRDVKRLKELGFSDDDIAADIASRDERIGGQQARYLRKTGNLNKVARTGADKGLNEAFMRRKANRQAKRDESRMAGDVFENSNNVNDNSTNNSNNSTTNTTTNTTTNKTNSENVTNTQRDTVGGDNVKGDKVGGNKAGRDNVGGDNVGRDNIGRDSDTFGDNGIKGDGNLRGDWNVTGNGSAGRDLISPGGNLVSGDGSTGGDNNGFRDIGDGSAASVGGPANTGDQTQNINNSRPGLNFSGNTFNGNAFGNFGTDLSFNYYGGNNQGINGGGGGGEFDALDNYNPVDGMAAKNVVGLGALSTFYQQNRFDPFANAYMGQEVGGFTPGDQINNLQQGQDFVATASQENIDQGDQIVADATAGLIDPNKPF